MTNIEMLSEEFRKMLPRLHAGDPAAAEVIDMLHIEGSLTTEDYKFIRHSFAELIAGGDINGLVLMGMSYASGIEKNMEKASCYYKRAAQKGSPVGMRLYGKYLWEQFPAIVSQYKERTWMLKVLDYLTKSGRKKARKARNALADALILIRTSAMMGDRQSIEFMKDIELHIFDGAPVKEIELIESKADEFLATIH